MKVKETHLYTIILFFFYPLTLQGRWGNTSDVAKTLLHSDLFSAAVVELTNVITVNS